MFNIKQPNKLVKFRCGINHGETTIVTPTYSKFAGVVDEGFEQTSLDILTCTKAGRYQIIHRQLMAMLVDSHYVELRINGKCDSPVAYCSSTVATDISTVDVIDLDVGDEITFYIYTTAGASTIRCWSGAHSAVLINELPKVV